MYFSCFFVCAASVNMCVRVSVHACGCDSCTCSIKLVYCQVLTMDHVSGRHLKC